MLGIEPAIPGLQGERFMDGLQFALAPSAISLNSACTNFLKQEVMTSTL